MKIEFLRQADKDWISSEVAKQLKAVLVEVKAEVRSVALSSATDVIDELYGRLDCQIVSRVGDAVTNLRNGLCAKFGHVWKVKAKRDVQFSPDGNTPAHNIVECELCGATKYTDPDGRDIDMPGE